MTKLSEQVSQNAIRFIESKTYLTDNGNGVTRYVNRTMVTTPSGYAAFTSSQLAEHLGMFNEEALEVVKDLEAKGIWIPYDYPQREHNEKCGSFVGQLKKEDKP